MDNQHVAATPVNRYLNPLRQESEVSRAETVSSASSANWPSSHRPRQVSGLHLVSFAFCIVQCFTNTTVCKGKETNISGHEL